MPAKKIDLSPINLFSVLAWELWSHVIDLLPIELGRRARDILDRIGYRIEHHIHLFGIVD